MRGLSNQFSRAVAERISVARPARSVRFRFAISLLLLGAWSTRATGANIATSTIGTGFQSDNLGGAGTLWLRAYTQQYRSLNPPSAPLGPNATTSITTRFGGTPGTLMPTAGPAIIVTTGVVGQNQVQMLYGVNAKQSVRTVPYGPTITTNGPVQKKSLSRAGDFATLTSTSGIYTAQAEGFISAKGVRGISADASMSADPPPSGSAAADAFDPFGIASGSAFAYDPTVSASVEVDTPNVAAGVAAYAVDSSVFTSDSLDNFADDGSPLDNTLWYFAVGGDTPTNSTNDLRVDFELNPLALNEIQFPTSFLASLGTYTDADSETLLIDQAIDQSIASQLVLNGGEVDLGGVGVFPAGTMFQAINGGVEYADDIDAVVSAVPEPASLAILAGGLLTLAAYRRTPKRLQMTDEQYQGRND